MVDLPKLYRQMGVAESRKPRRELYQQQAVEQVIDPTGAINPAALAGARTPRFLDYDVGTTRPMRVGRAGTLALASIRCGTAPSTGDAVIAVAVESALSGTDTYLVTVPQGETKTDEPLAVPVSASDWIAVSVDTANGASGVSASLTVGV